MRLSPSTRLGPYEILEPIGAGGMGEVYKARDTRLDRIVAIKVLPVQIAERAELRGRFEREARAVSSLNHPHICQLYDIGSQDGTDYLVMEYLVGETLAKRLEKGPLPMDQVLRYGAQVADALAQAHQQGVSHRDLKPGNIMLTKAGAKLLDFGLAKLRSPEKGVASSQAPTLTVAGMVLGTFQYMAPEQVQGKETDARADIFSFGAVLYEMATGKRAFQGETAANLITAILTTEPAALSTVVPSAVRPQGLALERAIRRCMAKDPEDRWQSSADLASELQWIIEFGALPVAGGAEAAERPVSKREPVAWAVAAVALIAAVLLGVLYFRRPAADARAVRLFLAPPENTTLTGSIAVSPDGRQVAFVTTAADGASSLWVRPLDSLDAKALPGTEGAVYPFWSPNSQFLAFFAEGKLKKIRAEGGPPQVLCDVFFDARGGTWNRDGVIVFSPNVGTPLLRIPEGGGKPAPATQLDSSRQESSHQWPHFLADGKHFLYLVGSAQADARGIYIGSLDSQQKPKRLLASDWGVAYAQAPAGAAYVLFLRGRSLMAQAFDASALTVSGEPLPVAENVWYDLTSPGLTSFSISDTGVLAYRSGAIRGTQLFWVDRSGKRLSTVGKPGAYADLSLSPDEKRVVMSSRDPQTGTRDIWILDWGRDITSRLSSHPMDDAFPLWSPDGQQIVFSSDRAGGPNLFEKAASGTGAEQTILTSPVSKYATGWTRDGRYIVYSTWDDKTAWDLWILPRFGDRKPFPYLQTDFDAFQAQFSPDGRWIAYVSNENNRHEVLVQPFPMAAGRWQISSRGGAQPAWRRDGKELYYLAPDKKLMAVDVKAGSTFEFSVPKPLFQTQITHLVDARNHYIPSADGQRFLVNNIVGETSATPITVVLNWAAGLKR